MGASQGQTGLYTQTTVFVSAVSMFKQCVNCQRAKASNRCFLLETGLTTERNVIKSMIHGSFSKCLKVKRVF